MRLRILRVRRRCDRQANTRAEQRGNHWQWAKESHGYWSSLRELGQTSEYAGPFAEAIFSHGAVRNQATPVGQQREGFAMRPTSGILLAFPRCAPSKSCGHASRGAYSRSGTPLGPERKWMRKGRSFCVVIFWCSFLFPRFAEAEHLAFVTVAAHASDAQTAPQRPSPAQTPVPGVPKSERVEPQRGKAEQYTLSEDRYEKAVAYSRAAYSLYFVSYFVSFVVLLLLLQ